MILLALVIGGSLPSKHPTSSPGQPQVEGIVFVEIYGDWEPAPEGIGIEEETATARLLLFHPSGTFLEHLCLIRQTEHTFSCSPGDGHIASVGQWLRADQTLHLTREQTYRTAQLIGGAVDPLCEEPELIFAIEPPNLVRGAERLSPEPRLDFERQWAYAVWVSTNGAPCTAPNLGVPADRDPPEGGSRPLNTPR